jgi:antitoxin ParD1/3/4
MTMNVNLTPELVKFVQKRVKAGRYNSASEVVRDALRKELEAEEHRNEMDHLIDEGKASGRSIDGEKAFRQIWAYIAKRKKERAARRASAKKAA